MHGEILVEFAAAPGELAAAGLVDWDGACLRATPAGRLLLGRVVAALSAAADEAASGSNQALETGHAYGRTA